jgi:sterol desaturase/sphingolipid hydroxylase (fatty acid hydroxylase superfamily)
MFDLSALPPPLQLAIACLRFATGWTLTYLAACAAFHYLGIHKRFGIFHTQEPEVHFRTAVRNWKVPFLWAIGVKLISTLFGLDVVQMAVTEPAAIKPTLPAEYVFLYSPNRLTDVLYGIAGFYVSDFGSWAMHWLNHRFPVLYKKYPVAHFVHHNLVFVNPFVFAASPFIHLVAISSVFVGAFMLSQGLVVASFVTFALEAFGNMNSHLGCDPLPWLTRLNHRVGGWIPWIPLHHQYHHLPCVHAGNYGNRTCLWDYVFGTLVPESIVHIESGKPTPEVEAYMARADEEMTRFLRGKTRLSLA